MPPDYAVLRRITKIPSPMRPSPDSARNGRWLAVAGILRELFSVEAAAGAGGGAGASFTSATGGAGSGTGAASATWTSAGGTDAVTGAAGSAGAIFARGFSPLSQG